MEIVRYQPNDHPLFWFYFFYRNHAQKLAEKVKGLKKNHFNLKQQGYSDTNLLLKLDLHVNSSNKFG